MHTKQLKIVGCGGHSKVVLDALSLQDCLFQISLCDSNKDLLGKEVQGFFIDSTMESLANHSGLIHLAIGSNQARRNIIQLMNSETSLFTILHPAAVVSRTSYIDDGAFIAARSILGPESYIGKACIINHGAVIDHEVTVGECSHIAPNSTLGGRVTIGKGVLVGSGAVILPGITVGDGAVIAAGAVVLHDVKENTTVKGVPAI